MMLNIISRCGPGVGGGDELGGGGIMARVGASWTEPALSSSSLPLIDTWPPRFMFSVDMCMTGEQLAEPWPRGQARPHQGLATPLSQQLDHYELRLDTRLVNTGQHGSSQRMALMSTTER